MSGVARPVKGLGAALWVALVVGTLTGCPGIAPDMAGIYLSNKTTDNIRVFIVNKDQGDHIRPGQRILVDACFPGDCIGLVVRLPIFRSSGQVALLKFEIISDPFELGSLNDDDRDAHFDLLEPGLPGIQFEVRPANPGAVWWARATFEPWSNGM
jgi:hypothetical protein